jgi:hypothetical protein
MIADPWQGPVSEQGESYVRAGIGNGSSEPITIQLLLLSAALRSQQLGSRVKMIASINPYGTGLTGGSVSWKWLDEGIDANIVDIAEIHGGDVS